MMESIKISSKASSLSIHNTEKLLSRNGYEFNYHDERWVVSKVCAVNFNWIYSVLEFKFHESYKRVLLHYVQNNSAGYAKAINHYTKLFFQFCANADGRLISLVSGRHVINYYSSLDPNKKHNIAQVLTFLKKWHEFGYEGINTDVLEVIKELRVKNAEKGKAVRLLCPYEGPLSDLEYEGLYSGLSKEFEEGKISLKEMVIAKLFLATGRRPIQIANLKVKDFVGVTVIDGNKFDLLRVPKVKQRDIWRKKFSDYALSPDLGHLLRTYICDLEVKAKSLIPISNFDLDMLPLFPSWAKIDIHIKENGCSSMNEYLETDLFHATADHLRDILNKVISHIGLVSERTGEPIKIFPLRLRRTLASRAAREGYGLLIIARLLDHADTQSAHIYTENTPEHLTSLDKALAMQLAPIAQAFAGTLVIHEKYANRGNEISSRIMNRDTGEGVGTCGTHSFCSALAPIACYTCYHFQPWLDGPHEAILESLITKRKEILARTQDKTIASVNDRTIFAVSQVVELCNERKLALKNCNSGVSDE